MNANAQMQFVVFEKFARFYYTKLQEKCYYLFIMYMKKNQGKSRHCLRHNNNEDEILKVCAHYL